MQQNNALDSSSNGDHTSPRKRPRKQQLSDYGSQSGKKYQSDNIMPEQAIYASSANESDTNAYTNAASGSTNALQNANNFSSVKSNNENTPPKNFDYYIKRPKTCSLLDVSILKLKHFSEKNNFFNC